MTKLETKVIKISPGVHQILMREKRLRSAEEDLNLKINDVLFELLDESETVKRHNREAKAKRIMEPKGHDN